MATQFIRLGEAFSTSDLAKSAWSRLRRFQNVAFVAELLSAAHPGATSQNLKKQAEQLRFCLLQAKEYSDAVNAVSLITQPTLLYYSTMNLVLAEILYKQSGDSSLDRAREQHKHHGLLHSLALLPKGATPLSRSGEALRASPMIKAGARSGTFELWHRTAGHLPLGGIVQMTHPGRTSEYFAPILFSEGALPSFPASGATLLYCLKHLPHMSAFLERENIEVPYVRGRLSFLRNEVDDWTTLRLTIHPSQPKAFNDFCNLVTVAPRDVDTLHWRAEDTGGFMEVRRHRSFPPTEGVSIPDGVTFSKDEVRFWTDTVSLNELGFFYVALFIAGNFARYYPDLWVRDVEHSTPLARAIEELIAIARERVPLLTACELERRLLLPT